MDQHRACDVQINMMAELSHELLCNPSSFKCSLGDGSYGWSFGGLSSFLGAQRGSSAIRWSPSEDLAS